VRTQSASKSEQSTRRVGPFDFEAAGIDEPKERKGLRAKILRLGERRGWHWLGRALQVQRRYGELNGSNVAAAVTLQVFLSVFPLLLVAAAVVGFLMQDDPAQVTDRVVRGMGLTGSAATEMQQALQTAAESRRATSVIGFLTLLWSAIGVASALQYALNQAWQSGGRGVKDKAVGLGWIAAASLLFIATALASTLMRWLPAGADVLAVVVGAMLTFALWMLTSKLLPSVTVSWRALVPGAILGVIGLEILKILGAVWVPRAAESSSNLYGTVGVVFAVLAWVLLFGKLVMYSAVLNVVLHEGRHGVAEQTIQIPKPSAAEGNGVTRSGTADTT
jgi:membrane protein